MPSIAALNSSRCAHKADAKLGVVSSPEFLNLHGAAAKGNIGLVHYALKSGQSPNSNLDGLLPLHAACSGGSELVAQLLIDAGADVNAPRLPRKHGNDKNKNPEILSGIGSVTGSTPLHIAAAHGHISIVRMLLSHGANPEKRDKDGLKAEDVAASAGQEDVFQLLKSWGTVNQEPTASSSNGSGRAGDASPTASTFSGSSSRTVKAQPKGSVDKLDSIFYYRPKASSDATAPPPASALPLWTPVALVPPPSSSHHQRLERPSVNINEGSDSHRRRPSSPSVLEPNAVATPSTPPSPSSSAIPSSTTTTPRAGQVSSDDNPLPLHLPRAMIINGTASTGLRKLGSKYSLLNIFKKANDSSPASSSPTPTPPHTASSRRSLDETYSRSNSPSPESSRSDSTPLPLPHPLDSSNSSPSPGSSPPTTSGWSHNVRQRRISNPNPSPLALESWVREPEEMEDEGRAEGEEDKADGEEMEEEDTSEEDEVSKKEPDDTSPQQTNHRHRLRFDTSGSKSRRKKNKASPTSKRRLRSESSASSGVSGSGRSSSVGSSTRVRVEDDDGERDDEVGETLWTGGGRFGKRVGTGARKHSFNSTTSSISSEVNEEGGKGKDDKKDNSRLRGDSVSSMSTDGSNPQMAASFSSGEASLPTPPSLYSLPLPVPISKSGPPPSPTSLTPSMLKSVSTHAQAQTLVYQAQQSILSMDLQTPDSPISLTEQLAAYGETLALERRFARGEAQKDVWMTGLGDTDDERERDVEGGGSGRLSARGFSKKGDERKILNRTVSLDQRVGNGLSGAGGGWFSRKGPLSSSGSMRTNGNTSPLSSSGRRSPFLTVGSGPRSERLRNASSPIMRSVSPSPHLDRPSQLKLNGGSWDSKDTIEIVRTLPTPTESPKSMDSTSASYAEAKEYEFRPFTRSVSDPSTNRHHATPPGTTDTLTNSDSAPLNNFLSFSPDETDDTLRRSLDLDIDSRSSSATDITQTPPQRSSTPLVGAVDYYYTPDTPTRSGKRFGLKSLFKSVTGK